MRRAHSALAAVLLVGLAGCQWVGSIEERSAARTLADAGIDDPDSASGGASGESGADASGDALADSDVPNDGAAGASGAAGESGACQPGATRACYDGPAYARGVGACAEGMESCESGSWGACDGSVVPAREQCTTTVDEDCDGHPDCTGALAWAKRYGGLYADSVRDLDVAASGELYITGVYSGVVAFGGDLLTGGSGLNPFIAKLDERGSPIWARGFPSPADEQSWNHIRVSSDGVYLAGLHVGTIDFGGGAVVSSDGGAAFLAKYDLEGKVLWSKSFGDQGTHAITGLAVDGEGGVVVGGYYRDSVTVGTDTHPGHGDVDVFFGAFEASGQLRWSRSFGAGGAEILEGMDVAYDGRIFAQVSVAGTADLGTGALDGSAVNDIAIAAYQADGTPLWSRRFGNGHQRSDCVFVSTEGTVLFSGVDTGGSIDFGLGVLSGPGNYLARFSAAGEPLRATMFQQGRDHSCVSEDSQGNVLFTGGYRATTNFGDKTLPHRGGLDVFVLKMDHDFNLLWSTSAGGAGEDYANVVVADPLDRVLFTGAFADPIDVAGTPLSSAGDYDLFVAMLSP